MTKQEITNEWIYRYEERIAILCGPLEPSEFQKDIARSEADEAIRILSESAN